MKFQSFLLWFIGILFAITLGLSIRYIPLYFTVAASFLPLFFLSLSKNSLFIFLPFIFLHSGLFIPGIPGNFQLFQMFIALFVGFSLLNGSVHKSAPLFRMDLVSFLIFFMIGWVLALMIIHGSGLRILGDSQIGGATYFQALFSFIFLLFCRKQIKTKQAVQITGILLGFLSILPVIANGLFELSGGSVWQQMLFFRSGAAIGESARALLQGGIHARISFLSHGVSLIWCGVFLYKKSESKAIFFVLFILFSLLLSTFSGYRSSLFITFLFVFFLVFTLAKDKKIYLLLSFVGFIGFYLFAMISIDYLPFGLQRILSTLPGFNVSWDIESHAIGTVLWRQEIWNFAAQEIPNHLLFGRGITYSPAFIPLEDLYYNSPYSAFLTGAFHQATLELLVLYGGPAFLACLSLYSLLLLKGWKSLHSSSWNDPDMKFWANAVYIYVSIRIVSAFFIGTSEDLLVDAPIWFSLFYIIRNSDNALKTSP